MAQHDYVIANGTGAAVRSDLNSALAAIVSNNSGATEPTPTYAYQWWADTTTGLLKIRNAANNAWVTVGTLASANLGLLSSGGTVTAALGSASTPGITFTGDTNTGIYSPGADQVAISTNGSERIRFGSAGQIGIGGANYGTSGQVITSNGSGSPPTWQTLNSGKILQVVRSHVAGKASTTSTSLTKLATSASITPSSSSSKIKITISTALGNADTGNANFSIVRTIGGSDTTVFDTVMNKQGASGAYQNDAFSWTDLDSPATTSAVTYSISGIRQDGNATPFVGGRNTDSSYTMGVMFILMEVAA